MCVSEMKKVSISFLSVGYLGHAVTILQSVKRTLTEKNVSLHTLIEIINSGGMTDEGNDLVLNYLLEMLRFDLSGGFSGITVLIFS